MKIVHVSTRFIRGGADENTLLSCNGQADQGHEVHLVVGNQYHPAMIERVDSRVRVHFMPSLVHPVRPLTDLAALLRFVFLFRRLKPDVVHTHQSKAGISARLAAAAAGVPIVAHGVHILAFLASGKLAGAVYLALERITARVTDVFVDVSDGMRDVCLSKGIGTPQNHIVVASGMDTESYRSARPPAQWTQIVAADAVCAQVRAAGRPLFVLAAGAMEPRKRILELVNVFARLSSRVPQAVLLVAGDGPQRAAIETLIGNLGLRGRVVLLGHRDDLRSVIALADVCVHAAEREGLPRVVVQYALAARPVVTTALPGLERVVIDGVSGRLVPPAQAEALEEPLYELLTDADLRARYAEGARTVDLSEWDVERMMSGLDRAYKIACRGRKIAIGGDQAAPAGDQ